MKSSVIVIIHGISTERSPAWYHSVADSFGKATGTSAIAIPVTWEPTSDRIIRNAGIGEGSLADLVIDIKASMSPEIVMLGVQGYFEALEVCQRIGQDAPVIIAHSAGSMLAYTMLQKHNHLLGTKPRCLITLGSPLWLNRKLLSAAIVRGSLRRLLGSIDLSPEPRPWTRLWLNVAGIRDVVAAFGLFKPRGADRHLLSLSRHDLDQYARSWSFARAARLAMK